MCLEQNCVLGCKIFTGGEIKHHPTCPHYTNESLSKRYDMLEIYVESLSECVEKLIKAIDTKNLKEYKKAYNGLKILINK
jgi:hypothetical protein